MATERELERLLIRITGEDRLYKKTLKSAEKATQEAAQNIDRTNATFLRFNKSLGHGISLTSRMGLALGAVATAVTGGLGLAAMAKHAIGLASALEDNQIAFGTMLQDMEKGKTLVADIQKMAAETPMTSFGLQNAARMLLQFGTESKDVLPLLRQLGDVVGGDEGRLQRLALAFGQATAAGRLMGQDLLQMINAGFNPLQVISKATGKSMADLKKEMEQGGITIDMVRDALKKATSQGGAFFGMMEKRSQTLNGLWSTLVDNTQLALAELGTTIVDSFQLKSVVRGLGDATGWVREFSKTAAPVIAGMVTLAGNVLRVSAAIAALIVVIKSATIAYVVFDAIAKGTTATLALLTRGVWALNAAILANPVTALTLAVTALIAATGYLIYKIAGGSEAMAKFNAEVERGIELNNKLAEETSKRTSKRLSSILEISNPTARTKALNDELKLTEKNVAAQKSAMESAKKALADMDTTGHFLARNMPLAGRGLSAELKVAQLAAEEAEARFKGSEESAKRIREELEKAKEAVAKGGGIDPVLRETADKLKAQIEEQRRMVGTGFGTGPKTAQEVAIDNLQRQGLDETTAALLRRDLAMLESERKYQGLTDSANKMIEELNIETATLGKSAEEVTAYRLALEGLNQAKLEELNKAIERNRVAQEEMRMQEQWARHLESIKTEISRTVEDFMTPLEKYEARVQKLRELLLFGLNMETYNRALAAAGEEYLKSTEKAKQYQGAIEQVNGVLRGSAEATGRIEAQRDLLRAQRADQLKPKNQQAANQGKELLDVNKNQLGILGQINQSIQKLNPVGVANL